MCLGIPAEVVAIRGRDQALVAIAGVERLVATDLIAEPLSVGDWVLVHVGFALATLRAQEAAETLAQIRELGGMYEAEVAAFKGQS